MPPIILSKTQKKELFLTETRVIMKSVKLEIPDYDIDFSDVNFEDSSINVYSKYDNIIRKLEKYDNKELTKYERNILYQFLATYNTFICNYEKAFYYDSLLNPRVIKYLAKDDSISFVDAKNAIIEKAEENNILFFNESHVDVRMRAFLISILPHLKKLGYKQLAIEGLFYRGNDKKYPQIKSGFYTQEPTFGILLRKAKSLGFELIPYDDTTLFNTSFNKRDSIQAENLIKAFSKESDSIKKIVLAGYSHIYKKMDNPSFISMVQYFKERTSINPYCIDVVDGNRTNYINISYPFPFLIVRKNTFINESPLKYDMQIHFPGSYFKTIDFLGLYPFKLKKINLLDYSIPTYLNTLLVIYSYDEYINSGNINYLIPFM